MIGGFLTLLVSIYLVVSISHALKLRKFSIAEKVAELTLRFPPVYEMAKVKARQAMVERGSELGVNWQNNVNLLREQQNRLNSIYECIEDQSISYPKYFLKSFHAYKKGNMCWVAAFEVESAALTVHSPVFGTSVQPMDVNGDAMLRKAYSDCLLSALTFRSSPKHIIDVGCSSGLSTLALHRLYPAANILGIDLSPFMVSVAQLNTKRSRSMSERVRYAHAVAEDTKLAGESFDLASLCLIAHELPSAVTRNIAKEMYRILRPGGTLSIMDMDPESVFFQQLRRNPFAYAGFKSTEPWVHEYMSLDLPGLLRDVGYKSITVQKNSPRHRTITAFKP